MRLRLVLGVTLTWLVLGLLLAAQGAIGASVQGQPAPAPWTAIASAIVQVFPWIPMSLVIIALGNGFPITRGTWRTRVPLHLGAAAVVGILANALLVLGFWLLGDGFKGFGPLVNAALTWATVNGSVTLIVYAAVLALTQANAFLRAARARELHLALVESQLTRAQLDALNAQIRPHFLFNTLHTIGQLWRSGRHEEADAMLDHLGALFHKVQACTSRREIAFAEELELVRSYLMIEETRFHDRLRVSISADDDALECQVPPLILQPIVENAIRHGISAASRAGRVTVSATLSDGCLVATVADDGPGVTQASERPGTGTGLRNTRDRLQQLYGAAGGMVIDTPAGGGTRVTLRIPALGRA